MLVKQRFPYKSPSNRPQTDHFWQKIERYARTIDVEDDLPPDWRDLNESYRFVQFPFIGRDFDSRERDDTDDPL